MLPFQKILFPVDYSESCKAIIPYVRDMTQHFSSQLSLVHSYGLGALADSQLAVTDPDFPGKLRTMEQARLQEFARAVFPGLPVESVAALGEPGGIVDGFVRHQGADLVMLATHGLGPMRRLLLGSVTAKVLHDVSAAVWTGVGSVFEGHAPALPYRSILCAVDDTAEARVVLKAASALASSYHSRLSILHVVEMPSIDLETDLTPYKKHLMDAADARLRELKAELGVNAPHGVVDAMVAEGVRQEAVRRNADLVVTGRGRTQGKFDRIFSQLYTIVRHSPCPVLSI
jgi:nucleotide-binding universal stress UspA family protein